MKTYRRLYPQVYAFENLYAAYRRARKGKRGREPAASFEFNLEANLIRLQEELRTETYRSGRYHSFYIHEAKRRLISAAPFRDRVVHHALCGVIEPIFSSAASSPTAMPTGWAKAPIAPWIVARTSPGATDTSCSVMYGSSFPASTTR
ncbi:MAG TPA: hypothetical protein VMW58_02790 [Anaerolineae bacterium]|nr:hypothetical protein [Anaerolineae bacterium]